MPVGHPFWQRVRARWLIIKHAYLRFTTHSMAYIRRVSEALSVVTLLAAVACITGLTVYFGFDHSQREWRGLLLLIRGCQIIFLTNIIYNLVLNFRITLRQTKIIKWIVDIGVLITLLPLAYPRPEHPWIPFLETILYSRKFLFAILAAYSVTAVSFGIMKMLGRRTNPPLIMALSFLVLIIAGSFLLMMPRCTLRPLDYIDSLFIATSAVSITGLCPVELSQTFTPAGLLILALLIQIGGLGIMTFTCFFAMFFSGDTSIYSQLMVKDMVYSKTINSLLPTLLYILVFTLLIETIGAVAIFLSIHDTLHMDLEDEIIFAGFHALSAFCNAGFSNLEGGLANPLLLHSDQSIYIISSILILAGGIGFPILMNFWQTLRRKWRRMILWITGRPHPIQKVHQFDLNTKIVLTASFWIVVVSASLFFLFEHDNSMSGMTLYEKIVQSVFNSCVPRSSGFSSMNPAGFMNVTLIMFVFLMWIGGASQSTAGGIKVNTFATMLLNLKSVITGRNSVTVYNRTIAPRSIRMAQAVVGLSILSYFLISSILVAIEPGIPLKPLLYESASALFTVGSSLGIAAELSPASKGLLSAAMFFGRVGLMSLLVGMAGTDGDSPARYPSGNIIIN